MYHPYSFCHPDHYDLPSHLHLIRLYHLFLINTHIILSTQGVVQFILHSAFSLTVAFSHYVQVALLSPPHSPTILQFPVIFLMTVISTVSNQQHPMIGVLLARVHIIVCFENTLFIIFHLRCIDRNSHRLSMNCCLHTDFSLRKYFHAPQNLCLLHAERIDAVIGKPFVGIILLWGHSCPIQIPECDWCLARHATLITQPYSAINDLLSRKLY